jgi:hypothetical protein
VLAYAQLRSPGTSSLAASQAALTVLTPEEFVEVVSAPGRVDDMRHCDGVYNCLETIMGEVRGVTSLHFTGREG